MASALPLSGQRSYLFHVPLGVLGAQQALDEAQQQ